MKKSKVVLSKKQAKSIIGGPEMNAKSSTLRRANKAVSDNGSSFSKNADQIQKNMKG